MSLLPAVLKSELGSLVIIQTSLATPWVPFLHGLLTPTSGVLIFVGILHPPASILPAALQLDNDLVKAVDWTANVPNYDTTDSGTSENLRNTVVDAIASAPPGPVTLIVDSADTLCADFGSISVAYDLVQAWYAALISRDSPIRMMLPLPTQSLLLPRILTPAFSPALVHLTLHPPKLLQHLATTHLAPAPPNTRFWALFSSSRSDTQAEQLVWGDGADGWTSTETAVEVLVRRTRGKRVEHTIEGWRPTGPCELTELSALRNVWNARSNDRSGEQAVDAAHNVSFNLVLTDAQQRARAQVPLPYVHADAGHHASNQLPSHAPGTILYDPDSADDLDDDDPDEDLDI